MGWDFRNYLVTFLQGCWVNAVIFLVNLSGFVPEPIVTVVLQEGEGFLLVFLSEHFDVTSQDPSESFVVRRNDDVGVFSLVNWAELDHQIWKKGTNNIFSNWYFDSKWYNYHGPLVQYLLDNRSGFPGILTNFSQSPPYCRKFKAVILFALHFFDFFDFFR